MNRFKLFITVLVLTVWVSTARAALVLHWDMNAGNPTNDSAPSGTNDLVAPGGTANPTFLAAGGVDGSGAYQFDGSDDYFAPTTLPFDFGPGDWTASFWIKTTDTGVNATSTLTGGYPGTPQVPVFGDTTNSIGFGLGVDGGKASFKHFNNTTGWHAAQGSQSVADGTGHFLTFVHHETAGTVDFYVDGVADSLGATAFDPGDPDPSYLVKDIGRSLGSITPVTGAFVLKYANMTLDDVRVYDTALSAAEIAQITGAAVAHAATAVLAASAPAGYTHFTGTSNPADGDSSNGTQDIFVTKLGPGQYLPGYLNGISGSVAKGYASIDGITPTTEEEIVALNIQVTDNANAAFHDPSLAEVNALIADLNAGSPGYLAQRVDQLDPAAAALFPGYDIAFLFASNPGNPNFFGVDFSAETAYDIGGGVTITGVRTTDIGVVPEPASLALLALAAAMLLPRRRPPPPLAA